MASLDRHTVESEDQSSLGRVLARLDIGGETLREPVRLVKFEHWVGHIPFAFWLIKVLRPRTFVELGTHRGNSYLAFCQAIEAEACGTRAFAVDTWEGDLHMTREENLFEELSSYHDPNYGHFSSLIRATFDEARAFFKDGSIDLLHIDGTHTYDAVKHDFEMWVPCLSSRAVVVFHDTNVKRSNYGVWKFWTELAEQHPHFEFFHSFGLGVVSIGTETPENVKRLFDLSAAPEEADLIRSYFAARGVVGRRRLAVADLQSKEEHLTRSGQALQSKLADSEQRLSDVVRSEQTRIADLEKRILEAESALAQSEGDFTWTQGRLAKAESFFASIYREDQHAFRVCRTTKAAAEERAEALLFFLRGIDGASQTRKARLERKVNALAGEVSVLKRAILAHQRRLMEGQDRIADAQGLLEESRDRLRTNEARSQTRLSALNQAHEAFEATLKGLIAALKADLVRRQETIESQAAVLTDAAPKLAAITGSRSWRLLKSVRRLVGQPVTDPSLALPTIDIPPRDEADQIADTGLFDPDFYVSEYSDVAESGERPAAHFARIGWREGRWPNQGFDPDFYLEHYPDVRASGVNPLIHYAECGLVEERTTLAQLAAPLPSADDRVRLPPREGFPHVVDRRSDVEDSWIDFFDREYYVASNLDIGEDIDPAAHFAAIGWKEGRKPNVAFDPSFYLQSYDDVARDRLNPLSHYVRFGLAEGRQTTSDLADEDDEPGLANLTAEDRSHLRAVEQTGLFDAAFYLTSHPEVYKSGLTPLLHYVQMGWRMGYAPNRHFDPSVYLRLSPDLAQITDDPFLHFARHGLLEGRPFTAPVAIAEEENGISQSLLQQHLTFARQLGQGRATIDRVVPVKMPDLFSLREHRPRSRFAVVVHVYYPELWEEIAEAIDRMPCAFDLFVSLVQDRSDHLEREIRERFATAYVFTFENRGRDILPFMAFAATGALAKYDLICKVHTKRSPHRVDGEAWRKHLIASVLKDRQRISELIEAFDRDPDLGMVVGDGQIFEDEASWAGNVALLNDIAPSLGYDLEKVTQLPFAGGSIFWLRSIVLRDLVGLNLEPSSYEPEPISTDGSLAHVVERLFSVACHSAGMTIMQESLVNPHAVEGKPGPGQRTDPRVLAFYLPQFHPTADNDRWWGRGFTEWTNVTKAKPLFPGHRQPRLPGELGFTDLRLPETRAAQAELARSHGISGFCYYYYWFGEGQRQLHLPIDAVLNSGQPDFPFMICWANESWTRNWDGANREVLVSQDYGPGWVQAFAREIAPILSDPRYVRLDGSDGPPMLMIYRVMHIPRPAQAMADLRAALRDLGVGEVHLSAGWLKLGDDAALPTDPQDLGLDSFFEFPPHQFHAVAVPPHEKPPEMTGGLYEYAATVDRALGEMRSETVDNGRHRSVMMGWDNTARRGEAAHAFRGATPCHFRRWLRGVVEHHALRPASLGERLVFVNAWNEWAEGTCLEPDRDFGRGWLEAVQSSFHSERIHRDVERGPTRPSEAPTHDGEGRI